MAAQKKVVVYGSEKSSLETGKAYNVSEKLAQTLVTKGAATLKAPKAKEDK